MKVETIKPIIYVSGPLTNYGDQKNNIRIAQNYAHKLRGFGFSVICPHSNGGDPDQVPANLTWDVWMEEDYSLILVSHGIFMLPHWKDSKGGAIEEQWAKDMGIPIFYYDDCLPQDTEVLVEKLRYADDAVPLDAVKEVHNGDRIYDLQFQKIREHFYGPQTVWQRCPNQVHGFLRMIQDMFRVHLKKNADYSPWNVLGTGEVGLMTRTWDKVSRLMNLMGFDLSNGSYNKPKEPKNESIEDTVLDLSVYAVIWRLYRLGCWGR